MGLLFYQILANQRWWIPIKTQSISHSKKSKKLRMVQNSWSNSGESSCYLKSKCLFKNIRDKKMVSMHPLSIPTWVGYHNGGNGLVDGIKIRSHMNAGQFLVVNYSAVLINSLCDSSISHKMLCTSSNIHPTKPHKKLSLISN